MNRIYIFFVVFIFYNTAFGQLNTFYSEYNRKEVIDSKIKKLKIKKFQAQRKDNIDSIVFKKTYELSLFEFDVKGNILMLEKSVVINSEKKFDYKYLYNYNNDGNLIKETNINFNDSIVKTREYYYENDRIKKTLIYDGDKKLLSKHIYHYDSERKLKHEEYYDYVDNKNNQLIHNVYDKTLLQNKTYYKLTDTLLTGEHIDFEKLILKKYTTFRHNNKNKITEETSYDTLHRIITQEKYSYLREEQKKEYSYHKYDSEGELLNAAVRVYDDNGNLTESSYLVHKSIMGKKSKEMQKRIFHYDKHNYLTKIDGEDRLESRFNIEINKKKNWVKVLSYKQDDDKLKYIYIRDIEYH